MTVYKEQLIEAVTEASVVAHYAQQAQESRLLEVGRTPDGEPVEVLVRPDGQVQSVKKWVDEYRSAPEARRGTAVHQTLESFVLHTSRFKDEDSVLWAQRSSDSASLTATFDYHRKGADGAPRFGEHSALYRFPVSDEWKAWAAVNGQPLSQGEFAAFLEDRIGDVAEAAVDSPVAALATRLGMECASASRLLELSRGLTVHEASKISQSTRLASGETQFVFETEHNDQYGAPLKVPGIFSVALPVFDGGDLFQLAVRLRYRVKSGQLIWFFEIHRADQVFRLAVDEAVERAAEELQLPLFYGTPESYR